MIKNPVMFVVEIGAALTTVLLVRDLAGGGSGIGFELQITLWLWATVLFANLAEAMAEGRGKAQADTLRKARTETVANRLTAGGQDRDGAGGVAAHGRRRAGQGRRVHPVRRRDRRGRRVGGRIGDHRRVGAGHPRGRRRSLGGHRRHARAVGLDQGQGHGRSRPDVPRSHDRARRRRRAAEDAERDRAQHPAGRADDRVPDGGRHAAAVCRLLRRAAVGVRAGVAAGLPDPDDDRRPAVGDRHRRHGPADSAQRAGDVGPRGRSGRRRPHAAARQDRHDHARQPPGQRVHSAARRHRSGAGRRRAAGLAGGRNAGGPLDRRAGQAEVQPPRPRTGGARGGLRAVHRADPHVGRRLRRTRDPQGRGRFGRASTSPATAARSRRSCTTIVERIARAGGTPLVVAERDRVAGRDSPQGHRQGRHARALRRAARDGHQDGDDHRRQPADRGGDRQRGRRRRLPRRGDAGRQDGADQAASRRPASWWR